MHVYGSMYGQTTDQEMHILYILFGSRFIRHALLRNFRVGVGSETRYTKFIAEKIKKINSNLWLVLRTVVYISCFLNGRSDMKNAKCRLYLFSPVYFTEADKFLNFQY
jgi:hypothetical protein